MSTPVPLPPDLVALAPCRLAVYGTLAPGESNHHQLASCRGTWSNGFVRGRRILRTFPEFRYDPTAELVAMQLFSSDDLPAHWARLDAFEGEGYRRIHVPVFDHGDALIAVANVYEACSSSP